jgi:heme-degrading monooxygenase HmoA
MHYLTVTECRVTMGKMQDFIAQVQHWEEDALAAPDSPEFHGVYLHEVDPSRVLVVTQFKTRESATAFVGSGLAEQFRERIMSCTDTPPTVSEGYDLFYAALADGTRVIFGEDG